MIEESWIFFSIDWSITESLEADPLRGGGGGGNCDQHSLDRLRDAQLDAR